ncbi:MAG: hypothetical protein ACETWE_05920 [Candidatus Bathyarchaeia archaeon]
MVVKRRKLKERAVYVYLPSVNMAKKWKTSADKAGTSISKFVIEHVEDSLREEGEEGFPPRVELMKRLRRQNVELAGLREENKMLKRAYERLDLELRRYRAQPFTEDEFQGVRTYDKELVALLRREGTVEGRRILEELGIDPRDSDLVSAVNKQLQNLEDYGLVVARPRGWKWIE